MAKTPESWMKKSQEYHAQNMKRIAFSINKKYHPRLLEYLQTVDNVNAYIRELIISDMEKKGIPTDKADSLNEETVKYDPETAHQKLQVRLSFVINLDSERDANAIGKLQGPEPEERIRQALNRPDDLTFTEE